MPVFLLPDLGEGLTEAEIVTWHVTVGDTVAVDQPVVEVETAKAVVEVPVPFAGVVAELHGQPGETLGVGSPLITVDDNDGEPDPKEATSGNVLIGYGTGAAQTRRRRGRRQLVAQPAAIGSQPLASSPGTTGSAPDSGRSVAVASPVVRRLARASGVDVSRIKGTGRQGLVTRADVQNAISTRQPPNRLAAQHPLTGPLPAQTTQRIPLQGVRKAVADKVARSRREIPEATVWVDVDATPLLQLRAELNAAGQPTISLLALIARFALAGLARFPELNAVVESDEIVVSSAVHLGFAAQTDRGLVVPVVPNAHTLSLDALALVLTQLTEQARAGTLTPRQLTGGSFTVNNYGVFGVDGSAAIINHPEVAILGIGRFIARPWVLNGQVVARRVGQLTLAFDHRVCDGGTAGGFLRFVADCIERPTMLLRQV